MFYSFLLVDLEISIKIEPASFDLKGQYFKAIINKLLINKAINKLKYSIYLFNKFLFKCIHSIRAFRFDCQIF